MIAYDQHKVRNRKIREKGDALLKRKFISTEQLKKIDQAFPEDLYSPNIFIRIGLFLFASFAISSAGGFFGFLSVLAGIESEEYAITCLLIMSVVCVVAAELLIKSKKLFGSGIEEALLYHAVGSALAGLLFMGEEMGLEDENIVLMAFFILTPLCIWGAVRYTDSILTLASVIGIFVLTFLLLKKTGDASKFIVPFTFMILSGGFYFRMRKWRMDPTRFYWKNILMIAEGALLLLFYFSGNYFVIRESSIEFFDMPYDADLPLGWFFWALTFLVPAAYIYIGLKLKDKILLWSGLILIAITVQTFRHYYSVAPPEVALSIAGIVMIALAWFSIRYFRTGKHGITYEADEGGDDFLKGNAEAFIIAQTFSQQGPLKQDDSVGPGGGNFGGGGSETKF